MKLLVNVNEIQEALIENPGKAIAELLKQTRATLLSCLTAIRGDFPHYFDEFKGLIVGGFRTLADVVEEFDADDADEVLIKYAGTRE